MNKNRDSFAAGALKPFKVHKGAVIRVIDGDMQRYHQHIMRGQDVGKGYTSSKLHVDTVCPFCESERRKKEAQEKVAGNAMMFDLLLRNPMRSKRRLPPECHVGKPAKSNDANINVCPHCGCENVIRENHEGKIVFCYNCMEFVCDLKDKA